MMLKLQYVVVFHSDSEITKKQG